MKNSRGFTLIELSLILCIIGILAAIAMTSFINYRQRGYDADAMSVLRNASAAQEAYYVDNRTYAGDTLSLISYELVIGSVNLSVEMADADQYRMRSDHPESNNYFLITGPGSTFSKHPK